MARSTNLQLSDVKTRYIRQVKNGWEYGYYHQGTAYKEGVVPTHSQAVEINAMAVETAHDNRPAYRR